MTEQREPIPGTRRWVYLRRYRQPATGTTLFVVGVAPSDLQPRRFLSEQRAREAANWLYKHPTSTGTEGEQE